MISHKYRCIFVHLRRTGGNSIEFALGGIELLDKDGNPTQRWDNELHRGRSEFKRDLRGHKMHDTALEIRQQFPGEFRDYFKFSIIRNPWSQMASLFRRLGGSDSPEEFEAFVRKFKKKLGTIPRLSLYDDGKMIVDYIGRFENLSEDFSEICQRIGLRGQDLPRLNGSSGVDYRQLYSAETREMVSMLYADDIVEFGYEF